MAAADTSSGSERQATEALDCVRYLLHFCWPLVCPQENYKNKHNVHYAEVNFCSVVNSSSDDTVDKVANIAKHSCARSCRGLVCVCSANKSSFETTNYEREHWTFNAAHCFCWPRRYVALAQKPTASGMQHAAAGHRTSPATSQHNAKSPLLFCWCCYYYSSLSHA